MKTQSMRPVLLLLAIGLAYTTSAATTVTGVIVNQTWTKAGSPYLVVGDLLVASLTIQAGVEILFENNVACEIAGRLTAVGNGTDPIIFRRGTNNATGWQGIYFNENPPGSELSHCRIEGSINSGIRMRTTAALVQHCVVTNNASPGSGGGINAVVNGNLTIASCLVANNFAGVSGAGIFADVRGQFTISRGIMTNNVANGSGGGLFANAGEMTLTDCVFGDNSGGYQGGAAYLTVGSSGSARDILIKGNHSGHRGGGIYFTAPRFEFSNCVITNNVANDSGGGVCMAAGVASFTNCFFMNNSTRGEGGAFVAFNGGGVFFSRCEFEANYTGYPDRAGGVQGFVPVHFAVCTILGNTGCGIWLQEGGSLKNCVVTRNLREGIHVEGPTGITNSTIAFNSGAGLTGNGALALANSIVWGNSAQIPVGAIVTFSDVQGGYPGMGNIEFNPIFHSPTNFLLVDGSPCIDAGNPASVFNDTCFPPSLGTERNDMGAYGGPLACDWEVPVTVTRQPVSRIGCIGETVTLSVRALGSEPLVYQWYRNGLAIPEATNDLFTLVGLQLSDDGVYFSSVTNPFGSENSHEVSVTVKPVCFSIELFAGLYIRGEEGRTYRIEYVSQLMDTNAWQLITNVVQTAPQILWIDQEPARQQRKFYRVVPE